MLTYTYVLYCGLSPDQSCDFGADGTEDLCYLFVGEKEEQLVSSVIMITQFNGNL